MRSPSNNLPGRNGSFRFYCNAIPKSWRRSQAGICLVKDIGFLGKRAQPVRQAYNRMGAAMLLDLKPKSEPERQIGSPFRLNRLTAIENMYHR